MNRHLEDDIARMAFGDLPPTRVEALQRLAATDPEVRQALDAYAGLRQGLKAMAPAMEHQLSSERLRNEILQRGLEPHARPSFDFRWLMLPVASGGAFLMVQAVQRGAQSPAAAPTFFQAPSATSPLVDLRDPGGKRPEVVASVSEPSPQAFAPKSGRRPAGTRSGGGGIVREGEPVTRVVLRDPAPTEVALGGAGGSVSPSLKSADSAPGLTVGSDVAGAVPAPAPPQAQPIVVIQPVRDAATGAFRATEVASPSNVLIGS